MSAYEPPTQNLAIFDPDVFNQNDEPLTITTGSKYFLKYPNAQGEENLQTTNVNGVLTANSTSEFKRPLSMSDTTLATNRTINSSFFNFYNSAVNSPLTLNGTLHNQNGSMFLQNTTNGGTINFVVNDAGGVQNTPLQLLTTGNLSNRPLTLSANNNLIFSSGTGIIQQSIVSGDLSTQNGLRRTAISMTSNAPSGTGTSALDVFDNTTGRGLFILPSAGAGSLGSTTIQGDCLIGTRVNNGGSLCLANWNDNLRNGLRIFTTDSSNCGLTLQCGQNSTNDWAEFRMAYSRTTNTTTATFNNPLNFNPGGNLISSKRRLDGLGTLNFTDISGNNTTTGSVVSSIYSDSVPTVSVGLGGFIYDCEISTGAHQFVVNNAGTITTPFFVSPTLTSVSNTFVVRNPTVTSNRFDIVLDTTQNTFIRARSITASTNALININCDSVNAGGVTTNNAVLTIAPTYFETRRPIQFNYLTTPNATNHLGFVGSATIVDVVITSQAGVTNFGNTISIPAGTWYIVLLMELLGSGSHNLTTFDYGIGTTTSSFTTALPYGSTYMREPNTTIKTTKISKQVSLTVQLASATTLYFNEQLSWSGGGTVTIGGNYVYTRLG